MSGPLSCAAGLAERLLARDWLFRALLLAGLLLPAAYAAYIAVTYDSPRDFHYFWAAGRIWSEGGNPYAPDFNATASRIFGIDDGLHRWLYSPHVWWLTRPLALVDFETAFWIWTALNQALIFAGTALVAAAVLDFDRRWHWAAAILLLICTASSMAASMSQTVGQFSAFLYFAAAAFTHAAIRGRFWIMVLALIVITMKASLGLPFVVFALAVPRWRGAAVTAGVLSLALAAPPLLISGVGPVVSGYLDGLAAYAGYEPNAAPSMTGLRTILFYLTDSSASGLLMAALAALAVAVLGWTGEARGRPVTTVAACIAAILFLVPLHLYDLMLVSVLAVGLARPWFALLYLPVLAAFYRVNRLSEAVGIRETTDSFPGSLLATLLLGLLLLASLALFWQDVARRSRAAVSAA